MRLLLVVFRSFKQDAIAVLIHAFVTVESTTDILCMQDFPLDLETAGFGSAIAC